METAALPTQLEENSFATLKISKLEEALIIIRAKIRLHSSYVNIRHLIDKEKELMEMLHAERQSVQ